VPGGFRGLEGPDPGQPAETAITIKGNGSRLLDQPNPSQGGGDREVFREIAPPGGVLVGLKVGYVEAFGGAKIGALQPIFQEGRSYRQGDHVGATLPMVGTVVARPGYAVGAINTRTGLLLDAVQLVFMRIKGGRLDPSDSYESSWLGDPRGGGSGIVSGYGKLVVGMHGITTRREVNALGLVISDD
jgi:hypothetical protein